MTSEYGWTPAFLESNPITIDIERLRQLAEDALNHYPPDRYLGLSGVQIVDLLALLDALEAAEADSLEKWERYQAQHEELVMLRELAKAADYWESHDGPHRTERLEHALANCRKQGLI
jgi:hypothetical protein